MRPLVILRSHKCGQRTREALAELGGSRDYDLLLSFDVTQTPCPPFLPALAFDAQDVAAIGLRNDAPQLFWRCGDLPLYLARAAFPRHDPLIQLDYDIAFPNGARQALDLVLRTWAERPDRPGMIGSWLGPRWDGWMWHPDARRAFPEVLGCLLAFIGLSAAAVDVCLDARRAEQNSVDYEPSRAMNAEALMPSAVQAAGLGTLCLSALLPCSIATDSFYPSQPDLSMPNFLASEVRRAFPERLMVHPALDAEEYAARLKAAQALRPG